MENRSGAGADLTRREIAVYLAIIVLGALAVRVVFSYGLVVTPSGVNFQDNDSWYHARAVEHLVANWPHRVRHDPYAIYGGQTVPLAPLLDFVVATAAVVAGLGSPSSHLVDVVAAWAPAVLGALIPLPVFFAGRRLFDQRAALLGAAFVAIFPGHLLERSRFGYLDHHVLEALLSMTTLWLAVRALQQRTRRGQALAAALAGLALGGYLLTWTTGSYIVGILITWTVIDYAFAAVRGRGSEAPGIVLGVAAATALAIVEVLQSHSMYRFEFQVASLVIGIGTALALEGLRRAIAAARRPEWLLPVAGATLAIVTFLAAERVFPVIGGLRGELARAVPDASAYTVVEAMPLYSYVTAPWMKAHPFMVLGTGLPLGVVGLVLLVIVTYRDPRPERTLALVWTLVVLGSSLLRNRFAYYLVPMLALLAGWVCAMALARASRHARFRNVALVAIGAVAFAPNIWPAHSQVQVDVGMLTGWQQATDWLRTQTPEPFGDPSFYLARYTYESSIRLPEYSVMAWWDYGYWIMRRGRRVPIANPTQLGASVAAGFLIETDPAVAAKTLEGCHSRYVVVDYQLPLRLVAPPAYVMGKFEDIAAWAGKRPSDFFEGMYFRDERRLLRPAVVFYPAYYQAMVNRLYQFGAREVRPTSSTVISYADRTAPDGGKYREITAKRTFKSYPEADAYLRSLGRGPHRLVGFRPDESPVPLEDLRDYSRQFASPEPGPWPGSSTVYVFQFRQ
ncbi:MAG TPA: STT3 domain-containing protein [Vicinamibacterales bacterium]